MWIESTELCRPEAAEDRSERLRTVEEIPFKELVMILRRSFALLLIIPLVITAAVGAYYYFFANNQYTADAKLYVLIDYSDTMGTMRYDITTSTSFAGDYRQLIKTHEVLDAASQKLGVEGLDERKIEVSSEDNTRVITLSVTSDDPTFCMRAANAISDVFIEYLATITETKSVSIASRALVPDKPSGPDRLRNTALALVASVFLVACAIITVALMNTTLQTSEDIENYLQIPVLARIAGYRKEMERFLLQRRIRKPLFYSVSHETREGIKTLSMNLSFAFGEDPVKTLAITSATPNEGKSTIAVMLAAALAEEGKRVLLCDMDFRNPSLGKYLGVRNRLDIVDVINGVATMDSAITSTSIKGVYLMDSHHKHVLFSNVIQSSRYQEFMRAARLKFDYIIFDTPPIGFFIDSAILASIADRTLLVVASGRVERALAKDIVDQLQKANASVVGVALNFTGDRNNYYGHYYRHYQAEEIDRAYGANTPEILENT